MVQEASPNKPRRGKKRAGVAERLRLGKLSEDNELQRKPIFCPRVDSWLRRWKSSGSQALLPIWLDLYVSQPPSERKTPIIEHHRLPRSCLSQHVAALEGLPSAVLLYLETTWYNRESNSTSSTSLGSKPSWI